MNQAVLRKQHRAGRKWGHQFDLYLARMTLTPFQRDLLPCPVLDKLSKRTRREAGDPTVPRAAEPWPWDRIHLF